MSADTDVTSDGLQSLASDLYRPQLASSDLLYHYTSLGALQRIVTSQSLNVSDVRFFNDAAELDQAAERLSSSFVRIAESAYPEPLGERVVAAIAEIYKYGDLYGFIEWLKRRLKDVGGVYVGSFSQNGNLLSQWRGYCPPSRGVSVGFRADLLQSAAQEQGCLLGRCIYDSKLHDDIMLAVAKAIRKLAPRELKSPEYAKVSTMFEADLLKIAALLKHPAFSEEQEWRVVSPVHAGYVDPPIEYREGRSMLVPYLKFALPKSHERTVEIETVILGPTTHVDLSMASLNTFLSKAGASPRQGISNSGVPLREL